MVFGSLFLIPLFIINIICSYTDVKYGKIKNKWIILGSVWVAILYISLFFYNYFFLHQPKNIIYLREMAVNGFLALVISYLLWNFKLLAAGDAKLFTLCAFLVPHEFYSKAYIPLFPSFLLLINIFIPLILILLIKALIFSIKEGLNKIKEFKIENPSGQIISFFWTYLIFILVLVIIELAKNKMVESFPNFAQSFSSVYLFFFLFFFYQFLFKFISKNKIISLFAVILGGSSISYLFFTGQTNFLLNILKLALIFLTLINIFSWLLNFYIRKKEVQKVKVKNLKEGVFLLLEEVSEDLKKKIGLLRQTGLTRQQIYIIKDFFQKEPEKEIKIYKTLALAPFVLLGVLITLITQDSIVDILFFQLL